MRSKIFPEFYKKFQRKRKEIFFNRNSFFNDILIINKGKVYNFDSISNTLLNNYKFRYTGGRRLLREPLPFFLDGRFL